MQTANHGSYTRFGGLSVDGVDRRSVGIVQGQVASNSKGNDDGVRIVGSEFQRISLTTLESHGRCSSGRGSNAGFS